jgi:hypothetical protein
MFNKRNLELFRLFPSGGVYFHSVVTGSGTLRCGSYQFAIRFANTQTGESTKFSLFTNPVAISDVSSSGVSSGLIGGETNKSIVLSVSASSDEVLQYDKYQIAVIENNQGNPSVSLAVSLSQFYPLDSQDFLFEYNTNDKFDSVGLEEVAIDDAAIETFKSLSTKNNRLIGGNTTYRALKYDAGKPVVSYGSVIDIEVPVRQGFDKASSESRGYFSGEVYRFAVTYWDEYGNFSAPVALDMSKVIGNEAVNIGFKDMKFPSRSSTGSRIVRTQDGVTRVINKGLRLAIKNHPSWAKGMAILRAERKKNIIFQSPLVPTSVVQSPNAGGNYPGDGRKLPSTSGTIVPKNLFRSNNRGIVRTSNKLGVEYKNNYDGYDYCKRVHVAYPPEALYTNGILPYITNMPSGGLSIEAVDYVSLRPIHFSNLNPEVLDTDLGDDIQSSAHCTFAAFEDKDYASTSKNKLQIALDLSFSRPVIDEAVSIDLIAEGQDKLVITSIGSSAPTSYFGDYNGLKIDPEGDYNGFPPTNQKAVVVVSKANRPDPSYAASTNPQFGYFSLLETGAGKISGTNVVIDGTQNENSLNINNSNRGSLPIHYMEVVNFTKGLKDDRYGDPNTVQEFITTGSYIPFNTSFGSSQDIEIDVFGGDCYISPFTFKVHDSTYGIANINSQSADYKEWGGEDFENPTGQNVKRAVPYRAASACIGLYLESEVNGLLDDKLVYKSVNNEQAAVKTALTWSNGSVGAGEVVSFQNKYYKTIIPVLGTDFPGKEFPFKGTKINNIGFYYLDLGRSYSGYSFPPTRDIDNFLATNSYRESRVPFSYLYNPNYSFQNRSKFFISTGTGVDVNRTNFYSRLFYSDTKILQTKIEGFSRFRVLNFYDLEESKGAITKIINHKGKLIGVQESAFCYIPFDTNEIEAQDGVQLAIRSGDVVGLPQYIEDYGSRYIRSVVSTPFGLYFADIDNSSVIMLGEGVARINDMGIDKLIREYSEPLVNADINDSDVMFYSDNKTAQLVMKYGYKGILISQDDRLVNSVIKFRDNTDWNYGMYINGVHFVIGYEVDPETGDKQGFSYYTLDRSSDINMFETGNPAYIKSIVNEEYIMPKVIDVVKVNDFYSQKFKVESFSREVNTGTYGQIGNILTIQDREAWFLINKIRDDQTTRRLRGDHFVIHFNPSPLDKMISFATKYRISERRI